MRLHVAGAARIVVVAPGAAHIRTALQDLEVLDALLTQLDRHAKAGKAAADDQDLLGVCRLARVVRHLFSPHV